MKVDVLILVDVEKNAATLDKQLSNAETELQTLTSSEEPPSGGRVLPMTEIIEELDEQDNVICTRCSSLCS